MELYDKKEIIRKMTESVACDNVCKDLVLNRLLPRPRRVELGAEDFIISADTQLMIGGDNSSKDAVVAERLAAMIEDEFGLRLPVIRQAQVGGPRVLIINRSSERWAMPQMTFRGPEVESPEGYGLTIDANGVELTSHTWKGLLWGAMTLRQLMIRSAGRLRIVGARISDWPHYPWRGFMIDSGRSPNSLPKLKRIIRICSTFKLNTVIFREGDDELNAVRYLTNPLGSENLYAFSIEEVKELIDYADHFGITVVPEIESLGHSTAKGFHDPSLVTGGFKELYEGIGSHIRKSHLRPDDPRSYELLESIYREWMAMLPSPFMHLGLDEVRLPMAEQARHLTRLLPLVDRVAEEYRKEVIPIVWADAPATPVSHIGRVIRCLWSYCEEGEIGLAHPHLEQQSMAALSVPGCPEKVFMAGGSGSYHVPYSKGDYNGALANLAAWARWGKNRSNFIGLLAVQWSGNMTDDWVPDFLAAGDYGWNPAGKLPTPDMEMERIHHHLARIPDAARPRLEEVDRPAWDGIWLKDKTWCEDIRTGRKVIGV